MPLFRVHHFPNVRVSRDIVAESPEDAVTKFFGQIDYCLLFGDSDFMGYSEDDDGLMIVDPYRPPTDDETDDERDLDNAVNFHWDQSSQTWIRGI